MKVEEAWLIKEEVSRSVLKSDQKSSVMGDLCVTNQLDFITLYTTTCTIFNTTTNHTIEANAGVFGRI